MNKEARKTAAAEAADKDLLRTAAQDIQALPGLLTHILNNLPEISVVVVNERGKIVWINDVAAVTLGYHSSELRGQDLEMLLPDEYREKHAEHVRKYFQEPMNRPMGLGLDVQAKRKSGLSIPVEISLSAYQTARGTMGVAIMRKRKGGTLA